MGWGSALKSLNKGDLRSLRTLIRDRGRNSTESETEQEPSNRPVWNAVQRQYCVHLSYSSRIQGLELPANTELYYTPQGRLASILLSAATTLNGQSFGAGSTIHLYPDTGIHWASIPEEILIDLEAQNGGSLQATRHVSYYRNGCLKETYLASPSVIQDHLFLADTIVHFSNEGRLVWAQLPETTCFVIAKQSVSARRRSCIEFHRDGNVRSLILDQATLLQGHRFDPSVQVKFGPEGHLAIAQISTLPSGSETNAHTVLRFERNGAIKEITVS